MVPFHHTEKGQVVEVQLEADKGIEVEAWLETETFHSLDLLLCTKDRYHFISQPLYETVFMRKI